MTYEELQELLRPRGWERVRIWVWKRVRRLFRRDLAFERDGSAVGEAAVAAEWLELWASKDGDPHTRGTLLNLAYGLRYGLHRRCILGEPPSSSPQGDETP